MDSNFQYAEAVKLVVAPFLARLLAVPSLLKPDSLIYCDGLFTILTMGESYPYKTQAFRALLRGDTAGDIVCCYETPNNPRGISTMADAVDADDLVQSIPSVGPLTTSRPDQMIRRGTDLVHRSRPPRDSGRLSVGRGIRLSGEVNSCERLFIEGSVEADLTNCRAIEIAEGGLFKGSPRQNSRLSFLAKGLHTGNRCRCC